MISEFVFGFRISQVWSTLPGFCCRLGASHVAASFRDRKSESSCRFPTLSSELWGSMTTLAGTQSLDAGRTCNKREGNARALRLCATFAAGGSIRLTGSGHFCAEASSCMGPIRAALSGYIVKKSGHPARQFSPKIIILSPLSSACVSQLF